MFRANSDSGRGGGGVVKVSCSYLLHPNNWHMTSNYPTPSHKTPITNHALPLPSTIYTHTRSDYHSFPLNGLIKSIEKVTPSTNQKTNLLTHIELQKH